MTEEVCVTAKADMRDVEDTQKNPIQLKIAIAYSAKVKGPIVYYRKTWTTKFEKQLNNEAPGTRFCKWNEEAGKPNRDKGCTRAYFEKLNGFRYGEVVSIEDLTFVSKSLYNYSHQRVVGTKY